MAQETTEEFAHRFGRAVEGHPLAPPTPHGRQRWVLEKLENEAGLTVSPNTMSKWFHGTARPRPDNIRKIARVLKVDEVWLAMGQKPADQMSATMGQAESAKGAVLLVAGLVEMAGGRVTFGAKNDKAADLQITHPDISRIWAPNTRGTGEGFLRGGGLPEGGYFTRPTHPPSR